MSGFFSEDEEMPSLQKLRVLAFLHIPGDASFAEARQWLVAAGLGLTREVNTAICEVHAKDNILSDWRMVEYGESIMTVDEMPAKWVPHRN